MISITSGQDVITKPTKRISVSVHLNQTREKIFPSLLRGKCIKLRWLLPPRPIIELGAIEVEIKSSSTKTIFKKFSQKIRKIFLSNGGRDEVLLCQNTLLLQDHPWWAVWPLHIHVWVWEGVRPVGRGDVGCPKLGLALPCRRPLLCPSCLPWYTWHFCS